MIISHRRKGIGEYGAVQFIFYGFNISSYRYRLIEYEINLV